MVDPGTVILHFTYVGIFCLLILGGLGFPFPEDGVLLVSGFLIAHGVIKLVPALLIIYPSLLIADFILYSIGRKYGRMVVKHKIFSRIVSPDTLLRLEEKFTRWGTLMVFLGRHFVGFRAPIFLVSGVMDLAEMLHLQNILLPYISRINGNDHIIEDLCTAKPAYLIVNLRTVKSSSSRLRDKRSSVFMRGIDSLWILTGGTKGRPWFMSIT